ncbi:hypothetical protein ACFW04_000670 [Cataglyphis niger]
MTDYLDPHFVRALCRDPERRTLQDLQIIYYGLLGLEALRPCRDSVLRGLCKIVRYERHHANHVLYYTGELATSWYILLSGSVFIDGSMFLPRSRLFKRKTHARSQRRVLFISARCRSRKKKRECGALIIRGHHTLCCRLVERVALHASDVHRRVDDDRGMADHGHTVVKKKKSARNAFYSNKLISMVLLMPRFLRSPLDDRADAMQV